MMKLAWDYTELAEAYDERADYDEATVVSAIYNRKSDLTSNHAEIGAGTGKLTKILIKHVEKLTAIEPNDAMRNIGKQNIRSSKVQWLKATGEDTLLEENSVDALWYGSSFNVLNKELAYKEILRISRKHARVTFLWNHRDLQNSLQQEIERIIKSEIPDFAYGTRREDMGDSLEKSGIFQNIKLNEGKFIHKVEKSNFVKAWKSHGTLRRQAKNEQHFATIIKNIEIALEKYTSIEVPYSTKIWTALVK